MNKIEASGRTVEEAVQAAAEQLGVSTDQVEYEVVDQGTKGFLGLGGTPTLVNAWVREGVTPAPGPEGAVEQKPEPTEPAEETQEEAETPDMEDYSQDEAMGDLEELSEQPESPSEEEPVEQPEARQPEPEAQSAEGDEFAETLMKTLAEILAAMKLDTKPVLRSATEEEVTIDLVGSDGAILIGRQGQTLDALQYLVGIIANRYVPTRRRVILDAEGYRERHKQLLERKAREYADAVKAEGKEAVLEPQPARDRRVIHMALAEDPDVYTYSEGQGEDRHVVISPKK